MRERTEYRKIVNNLEMKGDIWVFFNLLDINNEELNINAARTL